jgi:hypothetical protein
VPDTHSQMLALCQGGGICVAYHARRPWRDCVAGKKRSQMHPGHTLVDVRLSGSIMGRSPGTAARSVALPAPFFIGWAGVWVLAAVGDAAASSFCVGN